MERREGSGNGGVQFEEQRRHETANVPSLYCEHHRFLGDKSEKDSQVWGDEPAFFGVLISGPSINRGIEFYLTTG
jgi:hypothetical protein